MLVEVVQLTIQLSKPQHGLMPQALITGDLLLRANALWDLANPAQAFDCIGVRGINLQLDRWFPEDAAPGFDRSLVQAGDVEPSRRRQSNPGL